MIVSSLDSRPTKERGVVYTKPWVVELMLDLAGYLPNKPLFQHVAIEPSVGEGAFILAMARRLVESCRLHGVPIIKAKDALQGFEIDPNVTSETKLNLKRLLCSLGVSTENAKVLSHAWLQTRDFLENSLAFPVADFVIGNPPYIRLEEIPQEKQMMYRSAYPTMSGRADIYVAFFQAALLQLKPHGVCSFICADRWMLNSYGKELRKFITTNGYNVRTIIEAHQADAFESEVSAYPAITVISREEQGCVTVATARSGVETTPRDKLLKELQAPSIHAKRLPGARFDNWFQGTQPWPCSSPIALKLLREFEQNFHPLESPDTGTTIGIGVATGADSVFICNQKPPIEADRILPLALGKDVVHGDVQWTGHYLVNPWDTDGLVHLSDYPLLTQYLGPHYDLLADRHTARKDKPERWHKTIDRVSPELLGKPKLYIADIRDRLVPALDRGQTYPHHNIYWITSDVWDLEVLAAILMSDIAQFFVERYGVKMRGGYLRFQAQYLRRIRVPDPNKINPLIAERLRQAFRAKDTQLATQAALDAYEIDSLPT